MGVAEIIVGGLTTLVGGIGGGMLAGWYQDRRDTRDRPQLKLDFDAKADRIEAAAQGQARHGTRPTSPWLFLAQRSASLCPDRIKGRS